VVLIYLPKTEFRCPVPSIPLRAEPWLGKEQGVLDSRAGTGDPRRLQGRPPVHPARKAMKVCKSFHKIHQPSIKKVKKLGAKLKVSAHFLCHFSTSRARAPTTTQSMTTQIRRAGSAGRAGLPKTWPSEELTFRGASLQKSWPFRRASGRCSIRESCPLPSERGTDASFHWFAD
jgi:hypothetical protein